MWVWLIVSLIVLAACIIFALRIFFGNYGLSSLTDSNLFGKSRRNFESLQQERLITDLRNKLQSLEDNSLLYINQMNKIQRRLDELGTRDPSEKLISNKYPEEDDDENWKEMYYSVLAEKEKLQEQSDMMQQTLEETELKLYEATKKESILTEKKSLLEGELEEAYSLQNKIGELQRELDGATVREKELHERLDDVKHVELENKMLQKQYTQLKLESEELKNRIQEVNNRDAVLQEKVSRLNELESTFEMTEHEKTELKKSIQDIIIENSTLAAKLQQLQSRLSDEKFA